MLREIDQSELKKLEPCLAALAAHHNAVSTHFSGTFPVRPAVETLSGFAADLSSGKSRCAVAEEDGGIAGFCKIDVAAPRGYIDYLVVLPGHRGRGFGDALMSWAIRTLEQSGAEFIDLKVVYGNDAARFYERYGFKPAFLDMRRM